MVGSRIEFESLIVKNKSNKNEMSVEIKTVHSDGIIFYARENDGTFNSAIYLKDGKVI